MIFHGENAHNDYREEADNDGDLDVEIAPKADLIDDAANDAGHGVDLLAEDKGDFIDEHVTHDATAAPVMQPMTMATQNGWPTKSDF